MRMAIQGIGITGGFGQGMDALQTALEGGIPVFQQDQGAGSGDLESASAYLASITGLEEFVPKRDQRRIDHCSRMVLLTAYQALRDADLLAADHSRMGVIIASGYGPVKTTFSFLDSYLDFGYACSSPTHFSNSVHNAAAAHVSMKLKTPAPSLTVTQFEMSVPSALLTAQLWLAEGRVDQVLFGAVDEYCEVLRYCRQQFFGEAEQGPLQPFAFDTQTAMLGEGAVSFVLTRAETAAYAHVDGVRLGNHLACPVKLAPEDRLVIGADGQKNCGGLYQQALAGRNSSAYAALYGSFPVAVGFDLAVAALALKNQSLYASPGATGLVGALSAEPCGLAGETLACLKFGPAGDYGLIRLT